MFKKNVAILILLCLCIPIYGLCGCTSSSSSALGHRIESNVIKHAKNTFVGQKYDSVQKKLVDDPRFITSSETINRQFTKEQNKFRKSSDGKALINKIQAEANDPEFIQDLISNSQSADIYKNVSGYTNMCGIITANNTITINGNVAIYGGVYTQKALNMKNGSYIIIDNNYIDKIAAYNKIYNGDIFTDKDKVLRCFISKGTTNNTDDADTIIYQGHYKPVDMKPIKRKIKLVNISEGED